MYVSCFQIQTGKLPEFEACCDRHDKCYDTCNKNKAKCDQEFKNCLTSVCQVANTQGRFDQDEFSGMLSFSFLLSYIQVHFLYGCVIG